MSIHPQQGITIRTGIKYVSALVPSQKRGTDEEAPFPPLKGMPLLANFSAGEDGHKRDTCYVILRGPFRVVYAGTLPER